jgi:hypothetical protein
MPACSSGLRFNPAPPGPAPDADHDTTGPGTAAGGGAAAGGREIGLLAGTVIFAACALAAVFALRALELVSDTAEHLGEHITPGNAQ